MAANTSSPGRLPRRLARAARPIVAAAVLLVCAQVVLAAPPSGDFTVSPDPPVATQSATFSATGVSDPDLLDTVTVTWDFENDGTFDATGTTANHTYPTAGPVTVRMRLTDNNGEVKDVDKSFTVADPPPPPNSPPTAAIVVTTPNPTVGQPVSFSGSGSSDPDGDPLTYAWDLDNDGAFDDATGVTASTTYTSSGSKTVRLQVSSRGGLTDDDSETFTVDPPPNDPPSAVIAITTPPASRVTGQPVSFSGSGSSDPDGDPLSYAWDLDNDGAFDDGAGATASRSYATPGDRTVRLRVSSRGGLTDVDTETFTVLNRPPAASFKWFPLAPASGAEVTFTSTSTDPDGGSLTYAWDLDGNGATDFNDGTGSTAKASFPTGGSYPVRLRVRDGQGGETVHNDTIVIDNRPPAAAFFYQPDAPSTGDPILFTSVSDDPDGPIANQEWDLDDDGQFDDWSGRVAWHAFPTSGAHRVGLRVTDPAGASNVKSLVVDVRDRPAPAVQPLQLMSPFPIVRIVGRATSTGAKISRLSVSARRGASVTARCAGKRCPKRTGSMKTRSKGRPLRFRRLERRLRAGTKITVRISYPGRIGKYTSFKIKRRTRPTRRDLCLPPRSRPRRCPST